MTDTTTGTPAEAQAEARQTYRQSVAAEMPLSGEALGKMFGRSGRWGRDRIAEVRAEETPAEVPVSGSGSGNAQVSEAVASLSPEVAAQRLPVAEAVAAGGMPVAAVADDRQPRGARLVVWAGFLLGIAASIAANVAHAQPEVGPRLAGAFVPVALLLAVEAMSRPKWRRSGKRWGLVRYGGTGLVAAVAAVMSYRHMVGLLERYGEDPLNAHLGPLAVDGLMVVCGFALLAINDKEGQEK